MERVWWGTLQGWPLWEAARGCPELDTSGSATDPPQNTSEPFVVNEMLYFYFYRMHK